jgi:amino acid transporter
MGGLSAVACLFSLADLISVLIVVQTMLQFMGQCVAVVLLRRRNAAAPNEFRMPLYPLPVIVALAGWSYIVLSSNPKHIAIGLAMAVAGTAIYLVQAKKKKEWPYLKHEEA